MAEIMEPPYPATPSPSSRVRTPPAPHLGYSDSYEPYTPRKSSRIANRAANRTPSPRVPSSRRQHQQHSDQPEETSDGSPKSINQKKKSTMGTPSLSPQKKRIAAMDSPRRTLTAASVSDAASALGFTKKSAGLLAPRTTVASSSTGMLITPAKTPQKPPTEESKAKVEAFARTLFRAEDEVMPSPRRVRTQAHTLDSFTEQGSDESFHIHVDSHERIPEVDRSIDNPFYVEPSRAPAPSAPRRSQRQMVSVPGEGQITIEEAIQREDGLVTVFRGKKQFHLFKKRASENIEGGLESAVEAPVRRLTRASVKPRLLFPVAKPDVPAISIEDEEAETDIEDHVVEEAAQTLPITPAEAVEKVPGTPEAPRFAPASPPTTVRATRKKATPTAASRGKQASKQATIKGWRQTKAGVSPTTTSQKRSAEPLPVAGPSKRARI
ncbi:hypothetical protein QC763_408530 [Podospora pseudopauciseta]|uniref:Uncharacterized protein n=1 Tax=Podospora pseudopauciseta TaxID=2093780 RepID=A0ABR0HCY7_9PEZI|nr:hypothetical protein QC763_408530 [Podospora pseudopauciseta]